MPNASTETVRDGGADGGSARRVGSKVEPRVQGPRAISARLCAADPALARVIELVGPPRIIQRPTDDAFVTLAEAIAYQQLTAKAASTIFSRVQGLFVRSKDGFCPRAVARCKIDRLKSAGLSQAKAMAISDLARRTLEGEVPSLEEMRHLSDEAIVQRLIAVRGIGRWTVEMLLIFRLGRPDVLPLDDYGIKKGYARMMRHSDLPSKQVLLAHGELWRPYRSAASWYLWRAAELTQL